MDVPCTTTDCYLPSGTYGVLSTNSNADSIAYGTNAGWSFATGIGSLNAYNLITNWSTGLTLAAVKAAKAP
jgi:hypothetical protein